MDCPATDRATEQQACGAARYPPADFSIEDPERGDAQTLNVKAPNATAPSGCAARARWLLVATLVLLACDGNGDATPHQRGPAAGWPLHAGDVGGSRYSPLDEITPANALRLEVAW